MTDYLCPEGQRLWEEWDRLRNFDYVINPTWEGMNTANKAWTDYQDHKNSCRECGKQVRGFKESYLKEKFTADEWVEFSDFMRGQTAAVIDGEIAYYYNDVQRFCHRHNVRYPS
jgi:hypothetical protein